MCPPRYMAIKEVINQTQRMFADEPINRSKALSQFEQVVERLEKYQVGVHLLPSKTQFSDQVYTRDLAFTIGETLLMGRLKEEVRCGEEEVLKDWLVDQEISFRQIEQGTIEGGDVLVDGDRVWIGDSGRTARSAIEEIQQVFPQFEVIKIPFPARYLHLDCVLSILSPTEAIIYPDAFSPEIQALLASRWNLTFVTAEEQAKLAVNVLSIGDGVLLSQPQHTRLNQELREKGFYVEEVDISEIVKGGGAFRCITMPLQRMLH